MGHVDATLRLLDPSIDIDQIPNKRPRKRIKLFRQGELGRLIVGVLREADTPISTQDIQRDPRRWRSRGVSQAERHAACAGEPRLPAQHREVEQERQRQGRPMGVVEPIPHTPVNRADVHPGAQYATRALSFPDSALWLLGTCRQRVTSANTSWSRRPTSCPSFSRSRRVSVRVLFEQRPARWRRRQCSRPIRPKRTSSVRSTVIQSVE